MAISWLLKAAAVSTLLHVASAQLFPHQVPLDALRQQVKVQIDCIANLRLPSLRNVLHQMLVGDYETIRKINEKYADVKVRIEDELDLDIGGLNKTKEDAMTKLQISIEEFEDVKQKWSRSSSLSRDELQQLQLQLDQVVQQLLGVAEDLKEVEEQLHKCWEISRKIKKELIVYKLEAEQGQRSSFIKGTTLAALGAAAPFAKAPLTVANAALSILGGVAGVTYVIDYHADYVSNCKDLEAKFTELLESLNGRMKLLVRYDQELKRLEKLRNRYLEQATRIHRQEL